MFAKIDPITRSVVQHRLSSIVKEMGEAMLRTSYSQILNSSRDFSLAICDTDARLIAQADHLPVHVGALPWATIAVEERFKDVQPGDVFLLNDAYLQGAHLQDCTAFAPIFHDHRLVGYAVARAHMVDVGSSEPGGGMASTSIYEEGLRLGPVRVFDQDGPCADLFDVLRRNSRSPDELAGDVQAMSSAVRIGAARVGEIIDRWGLDAFDAACAAIFDYRERETRALIGALPDGTYRATGAMDDDGIDSGVPVTIAVTITVRGEELEVDLAGTSPQVRGAMNCGVAQTISSVRVALRLLLGGERPPDGGTFRPVTV